jgi:hypothetical protein
VAVRARCGNHCFKALPPKNEQTGGIELPDCENKAVNLIISWLVRRN